MKKIIFGLLFSVSLFLIAILDAATQYNYTGKTISPDGTQIHVDVAASTMTVKDIIFCRWDKSDEILKVHFTTELGAPDKTTLDGIVADN